MDALKHIVVSGGGGCWQIIWLTRSSEVSSSVQFKIVASQANINQTLECRYSTVDFSEPTILPPWVQTQSTPSMYAFIIYLPNLSLHCEKYENEQKEAGFGQIF